MPTRRERYEEPDFDGITPRGRELRRKTRFGFTVVYILAAGFVLANIVSLVAYAVLPVEMAFLCGAVGFVAGGVLGGFWAARH